MPTKTFNISFESTQNMQQYGNKITCTKERKVVCDYKYDTTFSGFDTESPHLINLFSVQDHIIVLSYSAEY